MKLVEIVFKKTFILRDDQESRPIVMFWESQMGLTYVSSKEITDEEPGLTVVDIQRYVRTGQTTPQLEAHGISSYKGMFGSTEPQDQPDGLGTNN